MFKEKKFIKSRRLFTLLVIIFKKQKNYKMVVELELKGSQNFFTEETA